MSAAARSRFADSLPLLFREESGQRIILAADIERREPVVEDADLAIDLKFIAGEAIEMRDDGLVELAGDDGSGCGLMLETIEPEQPEMLDGDPIHEHFFLGGLGLVFVKQGKSHAPEAAALFFGESFHVDFIGGIEAVAESVEAGTASTSIPSPFPTM